MARRIQHDLGQTGPLFGVHPGNKQSAYNWSAARYRELVERLAAYGRVMITGSIAETTILAAIVRDLPTAALPRVAVYFDLTLSELTAALSLQDVLTVSSTGPMHIAGVVGTPVVALFSKHPAHSSIKWAPLGKGHTIIAAPLEANEDPHIPRERGAEYMDRITVDQVVTANLHAIDRAGRARRQAAS
jgi:ADP-heptose:LPS heptosyltransferase